MLISSVVLGVIALIEPWVNLGPAACNQAPATVKPVAVRAAFVECKCDREFYPRGTRLYAFDEIVVREGNVTVYFSADAKVTKACDTIEVLVPANDPPSDSHIAYFGTSARVYLRRRSELVAVKPGRNAPADLAQALRSGRAYLLRVVH